MVVYLEGFDTQHPSCLEEAYTFYIRMSSSEDRRKRILGVRMLGVSSKNLPVDLFQHHADGIGCWPVSALTAAPRLRCRAAPQKTPSGAEIPPNQPPLPHL